MAAVLWSSFFNEVLPHVGGCPEPFAANAIRNAAITFCERTLVYKQDLTPFFVLANTPTYAYSGMGLPTDTVVQEIVQAEIGAQDLLMRTPDWLRQNYARDWRTQLGCPIYVTQDDERNLRVVPYPTTDMTTLTSIWAALKPTESAAGIEQRIYEEYKEKIAMGALARLYGSAAEPYFNEAKSEGLQTLFDSAIATVKWRAAKGFTRASVRVKAHFF